MAIGAGDLSAVLHPADQLVGLAGHGGNDDRDLVAGVDLAFDVAGDVADAVRYRRRTFRRISSRCVPWRAGCLGRVESRNCVNDWRTGGARGLRGLLSQ